MSKPVDLEKLNFKQHCPFYDNTKTGRYKSLSQIKQGIKCHPTKKGRRLYFKRDNEQMQHNEWLMGPRTPQMHSEEYDYYSDATLRENKCIELYNTYYGSRNEILNESDLTPANCSIDDFNAVNPEYVKLMKYSDELSRQLNVDPKITEIIADLIFYTNLE